MKGTDIYNMTKIDKTILSTTGHYGVIKYKQITFKLLITMKSPIAILVNWEYVICTVMFISVSLFPSI